MTDILDEYKGQWKEARQKESTPSKSAKNLITLSQQQLRSTVIMQLKNMIILAITLIGLSVYFFYAYHFQLTTSHLGITLMVGGLAIRILIEIYSIVRANRIEISHSAKAYNSGFLSYYSYRKHIHGPVTISILIGYTVGFYFLIPEFVQYMTRGMVILIGLSYLPAAAIFGFSIRKGIRDEMKVLNGLLALQTEIEEQQ
ncbi:MAG: hypothetical protein R8G66_14000 [Cytophagales bacterium]|nr:hypothetical protein [Cytophagales bacterium]